MDTKVRTFNKVNLLKQLVVCFLTTFCIFNTYSQNYQQFPVSNDKPLWIIKTTFPHVPNNDDVFCSYLALIGDTIINSITYEKFYSLSDTIISEDNIINYLGSIREETKKIYLLKASASIEKLIFNFSKYIHDTILFDSGYIPPLPIILNDIDTLTLNEVNYKRYWTSCDDRWIEGIGNTEWDIFSICPPLPDNGSYTELAGFKLNNTMIYGTNCMCENISNVSPEFKDNRSIVLFPNPASNYVSFRFKFNKPKKSDNYKIEIIDTNGKVVFNDLLINNNNIINLDKINSGVYIFKVILKNTFYSNILIINQNKPND
ncbi:MAG: T9SS type A sorting domain-containing protein [Bacteroidales bacterium]|nr:T9SS type A sorting domain-containing protein [Bacteroidales bacterium]